MSREDSVVSLLVEVGIEPRFCPSWIFLSNEEGVLLSCSVSVMGMSFFDVLGLLSMCGGLWWWVFCCVWSCVWPVELYL